MINAIIIENDVHTSNYLTSLLHKNSLNINIKGSAETVKKGTQLITSLKPELVFLDIHLNDGTGFEILEVFPNKDFEVIFITAFDSYYEKAMEHFAFNYLLKPINPYKLEKVIKRYQFIKSRHLSQGKYKHFKEFIKEHNSKILLQSGQHHKSVYLNDIITCTSDGNYTFFLLKNKKNFLANNILKYYDEILSHRGFFRANRSCIINTSHIDSIYKKETIILDNGHKIPVSTRNKEALTNLIESLK